MIMFRVFGIAQSGGRVPDEEVNRLIALAYLKKADIEMDSGMRIAGNEQMLRVGDDRRLWVVRTHGLAAHSRDQTNRFQSRLPLTNPDYARRTYGKKP